MVCAALMLSLQDLSTVAAHGDAVAGSSVNLSHIFFFDFIPETRMTEIHSTALEKVVQILD